MRWPLPVSVAAGWATAAVFAVLAGLTRLPVLGVIAVIGFVWGLAMTSNLEFALPIGIRLDMNELHIGGMRVRERLAQRGKWPPRKPFVVGRQSRAVFNCQWKGVRSLYLITEPAEIKRVRRDLRRFIKRNETTIPLGAFRQGLVFSKAVLVITHDARYISSDPPEFRGMRGQYGIRLSSVESPTWMVPTRNPEALRAALAQVPDAPRVQDKLPPEAIFQFFAGRG